MNMTNKEKGHLGGEKEQMKNTLNKEDRNHIGAHHRKDKNHMSVMSHI